MPESSRRCWDPVGETGVREAAETAVAAAEAAPVHPAGPERPLASVATDGNRGFLQIATSSDSDAFDDARPRAARAIRDQRAAACRVAALGAYPSLLRGKRVPVRNVVRGRCRARHPGVQARIHVPFAEWMAWPARRAGARRLHTLAVARLDRAARAGRSMVAWQRGQAHWSRGVGLGTLGRFSKSPVACPEPAAAITVIRPGRSLHVSPRELWDSRELLFSSSGAIAKVRYKTNRPRRAVERSPASDDDGGVCRVLRTARARCHRTAAVSVVRVHALVPWTLLRNGIVRRWPSRSWSQQLISKCTSRG